MDRSNVLKLIRETFTPDAMGVQRPTETTRTVFCDVSSVSLTEWTEGGRIGLNPEYRFTMFRYDYEGETVAEFDGVKLNVVSDGDFVSNHRHVRVERVEGNRIVVRETDASGNPV